MAGTVVFYFSATGNSWHAATTIAEQLEDTQMVPVPAAMKDINRYGDVKNVGFVMPVYAGGLPAIMQRFLRKLPIRRDGYYFAVFTCGGWPGGAAAQLAQVLEEKGGRLSYANTVKTVDNYVLFCRIPQEGKRQTILLDADEKLRWICRDLQEKKSRQLHGILTPVFIKHNRRAVEQYADGDKQFTVNSQCTGCGVCEKVCPVSNITVTQGGVQFHHHCEMCLACLHWCPHAAIDHNESTIGKGRYHDPRCTAGDIVAQKK